jgi:hypothetical protein
MTPVALIAGAKPNGIITFIPDNRLITLGLGPPPCLLGPKEDIDAFTIIITQNPN